MAALCLVEAPASSAGQRYLGALLEWVMYYQPTRTTWV